jgi:ankyrin repeat protein
MSTILRKGVAGDDLHLMLQSLIVEEGHVDDKLIQLLLQNRASINYVGLDGRNCIEMAAKRGHSKMIELLCHPGQTNQSHIDSTILSKAFESCINLQQDRRFSTAKQLLDLCVSVNTIDTQLRKIVMDNDIDLLRLMLHSRNKAPLQDTEVLIIAIRTGNIDLIRLLLQSSLTSNVVNTAFTKAIEKNLLANTQIGIGTGELLLQTNQIRHENINNALIHVVQNYGLPTRDQFVDLLLQHKADVNWQSAAVIKEAARNPEPDLFKKLLQYGARTNLVILALIHLAAANKWSEKSLLERLRICIRPIDDALEQRDGNIIIMAMFNFPNGTQLVKLLLKEGWSPNYKALCKIEENEEEEIVPALLWAICQRNIINTSVIKELLNAGGKSHKYNYKNHLTRTQ